MSPPRGPRGALRRLRRPLPGLVVALVGLLLVLLAPPAAVAAPGERSVDVVLDTLTPRVVTADGPPELVVSGRVVNRSAVTARDVGVRLERGAAVSGSRAALGALDGADTAGAPVRTPSIEVAPQIAPGTEAPFLVRVPLTGPGSLAIAAAGVHPVVVGVDGALGGAGATRLGAVRFLLPVVGVPGGGPPAAPPVGRAVGVSLLYPLADRPRRIPVLPGAPTLLTDDDLSTSFAPGGRLAGLVDALGRSAPPGSAAARSVCLAVDADLLETAQAMSGGYEVRTPGGGTTAGTGAAAAGRWLDAVRTQARGRCVTALPYAGTDLVATTRGGQPDLTAAALSTGTRRVGDILQTTPVADTVWPAGGVVDERTAAALAAGGTRNLLLDGDVLDGTLPTGALARLPGTPGPAAVTLDPVAAEALGPRTDDDGDSTSPAGTSAPLAAQDALGVLGLRALQDTPATGPPPVEVVAPPTDWAADDAEAGALLAGIEDLTRLGLARPLDLGSVVAGVDATTPLPRGTLGARSRDVDAVQESVVARAAAARDRQRELLAATERDGVGAPSPSDYVEPLTDAILRSLSAAWRGDPAVQDAQVGAVERQVGDLRAAVRVVQPSGSYSLGTNDAPLLLTVENRLPVAVRVQVVLEPTNGLRTAPLPVVTVPAFGSRQVQVEVEVTRAGQFQVDAQARTPGGEPLGPTARLLLRSTAYGTITVWLTASAAVVLVILASVRIARRVLAARRDRTSRRRHRRGDPTGPEGPEGTDLPTRELQKR